MKSGRCSGFKLAYIFRMVLERNYAKFGPNRLMSLEVHLLGDEIKIDQFLFLQILKMPVFPVPLRYKQGSKWYKRLQTMLFRMSLDPFRYLKN